ncbi:DUF1080 domain-containing protein [soil metagenome]
MDRIDWTTALLCLGMLAAQLAAVEGQDQGSEEGWTSLFDGETLSGWEMVKLRPDSDSTWEVEDGLIVGRGDPSMLYSAKGDYQNFRFRAELKINDGGNSGQYFRAAQEPSFGVGYEAQVNSTHRDPIKTGSIYTKVHIYEELVPPDTFFTQEIEVVDREYRGRIVTAIKVSVDGKVLYEYLDHDRPTRSGHFAFQQHDPGSVVSIRKIEVIELPPTSD